MTVASAVKKKKVSGDDHWECVNEGCSDLGPTERGHVFGSQRKRGHLPLVPIPDRRSMFVAPSVDVVNLRKNGRLWTNLVAENRFL